MLKTNYSYRLSQRNTTQAVQSSVPYLTNTQLMQYSDDLEHEIRKLSMQLQNSKLQDLEEDEIEKLHIKLYQIRLEAANQNLRKKFEKFKIEKQNLVDEILDDSVKMTEDELQDKCHLVQQDVWQIKSYLHEDCEFNIDHIRDLWELYKDPENHQLSEPEKRIARIRDFYWVIRECDEEFPKLKHDIQSFIKNIARKTMSDVVQKQRELSTAKSLSASKIKQHHKCKNFQIALTEISEYLPIVYKQFSSKFLLTEKITKQQFTVNNAFITEHLLTKINTAHE